MTLRRNPRAFISPRVSPFVQLLNYLKYNQGLTLDNFAVLNVRNFNYLFKQLLIFFNAKIIVFFNQR